MSHDCADGHIAARFRSPEPLWHRGRWVHTRERLAARMAGSQRDEAQPAPSEAPARASRCARAASGASTPRRSGRLAASRAAPAVASRREVVSADAPLASASRAPAASTPAPAREGAPGSRRERALQQRLYLLERRSASDFTVLGSTGNAYAVSLEPLPRCSCPDFRFHGRSKRCKHILFVLCVCWVHHQARRLRTPPHGPSRRTSSRRSWRHRRVTSPMRRRSWWRGMQRLQRARLCRSSRRGPWTHRPTSAPSASSHSSRSTRRAVVVARRALRWCTAGSGAGAACTPRAFRAGRRLSEPRERSSPASTAARHGSLRLPPRPAAAAGRTSMCFKTAPAQPSARAAAELGISALIRVRWTRAAPCHFSSSGTVSVLSLITFRLARSWPVEPRRARGAGRRAHVRPLRAAPRAAAAGAPFLSRCAVRRSKRA